VGKSAVGKHVCDKLPGSESIAVWVKKIQLHRVNVDIGKGNLGHPYQPYQNDKVAKTGWNMI
jgi:hypothetical protein